MSNKKFIDFDWNPAMEFTRFAKYLNIPLEEINKAFAKENSFDEDTAKRIIRGKSDPIELTPRKYRHILLEALCSYIQKLRNRPYPKRYSRTEKQKNVYDTIRQKRIEDLTKNLHENWVFVKKQIKLSCSLYYSIQEINFNDNLLSLNEKIEVLKSYKEHFFTLSPQNAYILSQNTDAFFCLLDPEIYDFYDCVLGIEKEAKEMLKNVILSHSFGEIIQALSEKSFIQWFQIRNGYYTKITDQKLSKYKKKITKRRINALNAHNKKLLIKGEKVGFDKKLGRYILQQKSPEEYLAEQDLKNESWRFFCKRMEKTALSNSSIPLLLIYLTRILDDTMNIDLIVGFLCCNSFNKDFLLKKAQELVEREKNIAQQTTD